ncbi:MAG TPA: serine/threonine-protein kinase, partial [Thermoanaerobaculia bacterium]|nr:serine/threonine-protein kinase [Thermoanaerobaculia bacterium]
LSPRYAAKLAIEALHGLDAIHRAGIVHRDISPENIMIARDEEGEQHVKLIDLGIAKQGDGTEANKTKTGMFVGKWKYCSPEHLGMLDAGERIDGRADIYSFGIVLYEMLTGVPPFQAETPHAYLMLHASEKPRPLREVNPSMPSSPELEALIFRALEKDRKKRFATSREMARALEEIEPSLDDQTGAPPPLPKAYEVTEEPTRVATPTVPSGAAPPPRAVIDPNASTVLTANGEPMARALRKVSTTDVIPVPGGRRSPMMWIAIVMAVVAIGVVAAVMMRTQQPVVTKAPPVVAVAPGRVALNAFPWGEVTSIRNVANGATIDLKEPFVTPAPVDLAPGTYEITLSNPSFRSPITRKVDVKAGQEQLVNVQFADPSTATLPQLSGGTP